MSLMKTMIADLDKEDECPVQSPVPQVEEVSVVPEVLFVATDLESRNLECEEAGNRDIEYEGKIYRRLDPDYFAWLRSRMVVASNAHKAGKLSDNTWNLLRERFNRIQKLVIEEFSEDVLQKAVRGMNPRTYQVPAIHQKKDWIYPAEEA